MRKMILSDIARLRKMPDLAKKIEAYQPQPDPLQQQMAQLQVQLLQAQIEETRAKTQSLMASAGLHAEKANTEAVKQGHIKSDTDLKNLDFVEQESGVKQERDLQKEAQKAQHQAAMQVMQHGFDKELQSSEK